MTAQKHLNCIHLKKQQFNQDDCKRLHKNVKDLPEFSHRENRRFYFYCTLELWELIKGAILTQNKIQDNMYNIS